MRDHFPIVKNLTAKAPLPLLKASPNEVGVHFLNE